MEDNRLRIAILVESFPCATEVPILNQLSGLIECGIDLTVFAYNKDLSKVHPAFAKYNFSERTIYIDSIKYSKHTTKVQYLLSFIAEFPHILKEMWVDFKRTISCFNEKKYGELSKNYRLFNLYRYFREYPSEFDLFFCQFGPMGLRIAALKELGLISSKLITSFRGYDINVVPNMYSKSFYKLLVKWGDGYTANTIDTKATAVKLGFEESKIHIIHSSLNVNEFLWKERTLEKDATLNLLSVGSLLPVKGHIYAIRAIKMLLDTRNDISIRYRIVGFGHLKEELMNSIKDYELQSIVTLEGFKSQDELIKLYLTSHILIHPSIEAEDGSKEAQGLVIQEAQATGLPIIASNIGGIPEGMIDGKSGILVEQKNSNQIKEALLKIIEEQHNWPNFAKNGRKFVEMNFDNQSNSKKLVEIFNSVLNYNV